ncbi:hypothetical protein JTE90_009881 [Oedothorax gibbosus]|uniref:Uncharacterized protein n=1 Tax=Oedothorax gibbosus TaxID=931172 RepID=A0AAV6UU96_9ARAC|nr:hypothetical protein JTE90_009881 [Oedothorax gibbosus]
MDLAAKLLSSEGLSPGEIRALTQNDVKCTMTLMQEQDRLLMEMFDRREKEAKRQVTVEPQFFVAKFC